MGELEPHAGKKTVFVKVVCANPKLNRWFGSRVHANRYRDILESRKVKKVKVKVTCFFMPQTKRQMVNFLNRMAPIK